MAATDEEVQKLGKHPIYSGKEDEWSEWSFVMTSYVSLLFTHVPALLAGAEDSATSPDMSMTRIRATLTEDGATVAQKLFHVLVMNVRGPALAVIRGITDMNGALAWRALITRYAPNTAPRVQSLMSAILNVKTFPLEVTAYEIALYEWQEDIRKRESMSGDRFNVSVKKALCLDKAPSSVRVPLQMQNQETFEAMTPVTLQFLQRNAQNEAGVTVTPNNRRGPDDMEIDAFTKKGKGKGKGKGKNSVNEVTTPTESTTTPPVGTSASQISRITQDDTKDGPVSMDEDEEEDYETGYILAAIRHREPFRQSKDWYVVHVLVGNCADEHVCSPRGFEWIAIEPRRNPPSGIGEWTQSDTAMKLRDGRKIRITF